MTVTLAARMGHHEGRNRPAVPRGSRPVGGAEAVIMNQPTYEVHHTEFEEFCATFAPPYADTWEDGCHTIEADKHERAIVDILEVAWQTSGTFEQPLMVDDETNTLTNGCHRIAALRRRHRAGEHVIVPWTFDDLDGPETTIEVTIAVGTPPSTDTDSDLDWFDEVMGVIRSFPLGGSWAETDTMSSMVRHDLADIGITEPTRCVTGYWYWPPDRHVELVAALDQRMAAANFDGQCVAASARRWDIDGEEETVLWTRFGVMNATPEL